MTPPARVPAPAPLGPPAPRRKPEAARLPWPLRLRDGLSNYLPLLLMALLAAATWWLVKNSPGDDQPGAAAAPKHEADYVMQRFVLQRFGADGRLVAQVEGAELRHYPDTDTLEIDTVEIRAYSPDGSTTHATARRAVANGDASEVQLQGGAQVRREGGPVGEPVTFEGEFLHAFLNTEQLRSHLPVVMREGTSEIHAAGLDYDNLSRRARFTGPVKARFIRLPRR